MTLFRRKLLVLSSPAGGSRYFRLVLNNAAVEVNHEGMGRDGNIGMFFAVEDVWYPGKHWNDDLGYEDEALQRRSHYAFEQTWHLTRDPRRVIPSLAAPHMAAMVWVWSERHTGISCGVFPKLLRAMKFWVAWNQIIESNDIDFRIRVEDVESRWDEIRDRLGIVDPEYATCPQIPKDTGHHDHGPNKGYRPMSFDELESVDLETAKRVREIAERYGYDITKELP